MRRALPLLIELFCPDEERGYIRPEELRELLVSTFPQVVLDSARGKQHFLDEWAELLADGVPETISAEAELASFVTIRWPDWPGQAVTSTITGLDPHFDRLCFESTRHDISFIVFAARDLARRLGFEYRLGVSSRAGLEVECWPGPFDASEWIQDRYNRSAACSFQMDPTTGDYVQASPEHPRLREITNWPTVLLRALIAYLENVRSTASFLKHFDSPKAYASLLIHELNEFAPVRHCWSVELESPAPFFNEVLIDHGDWLTHFKLSGLPTGALTDASSA